MKTFKLDQLQEAQDWRPQIERFVMADAVYVIEDEPDYSVIPVSVSDLIATKDQVG